MTSIGDVAYLAGYLDDSGEDGDAAWAPVGAGVSPVTFPGQKLTLLVEVLVNGAWIDFSSRVKYEEQNAIYITRARPNQQGTAPSSTCRLTFLNPDRYLSPRNVLSPYYPYLGRGSKLRVTVDPGSGASVRFVGRIPEWPPRFTTGDDRTVTVEAKGALYTIESDQEEQHSSIYRYITTHATQPLVYWPCEDEDGAVFAASGLSGGLPMVAGGGSTTGGGVRFGQGNSRSQPAYTGYEIAPVATKPLASLIEGGSLIGNIPASAPSPIQWTVQFVGRLWAYTGFTGNDVTLAKWTTPGGTFSTWEIRMASLDGAIQLVGGGSTVIITPANTSLDLMQFRVTATQNGGNVDTTLRVSRASSSGEGGSLDTDSRAGTLAMPTTFFGNPDLSTVSAVTGGGADNQTKDLIVGHVSVYDTTGAPGMATTVASPINVGTVLSPWMGWAGEQPTARFLRVCQKEGIDAVVLEHVTDSQPMGSEGISTVAEILRDCETTSQGLIDETMAGELRLASRTARWVPDVPLVLDYAHPTYGNQVSAIQPTDDYTFVNDWEVTRTGGVKARAEQLTGPLNVNDPEDDFEGVGRRKESISVNLYADPQAIQHANALLAATTVDEPRYPRISIALHRNPELIPAWLATDINGRLSVLNPPTDVGPDDILQYLDGVSERLTQFTWDIDINAAPVSGREVGRYNDATGLARYDCAGSTLSADIDSAATSLALSIVDGCVWAHDYGDYTIRVGGEDMVVTAVAAATGTYPSRSQTLTVTRSVNGAVLSHLAGTAVRLKKPTRYAL
jgi:hypothetical protein